MRFDKMGKITFIVVFILVSIVLFFLLLFISILNILVDESI